MDNKKFANEVFVSLLKTKIRLEIELKKTESELKSVTDEAYKIFGEGKHSLAEAIIELRKVQRDTPAWKAISESVATRYGIPPNVLEEIKSQNLTHSEYIVAKIIG